MTQTDLTETDLFFFFVQNPSGFAEGDKVPRSISALEVVLRFELRIMNTISTQLKKNRIEKGYDGIQ